MMKEDKISIQTHFKWPHYSSLLEEFNKSKQVSDCQAFEKLLYAGKVTQSVPRHCMFP